MFQTTNQSSISTHGVKFFSANPALNPALAQWHAMPRGQEQLHGTAGAQHCVQLCDELLTFQKRVV
jgi:hypothetical protein